MLDELGVAAGHGVVLKAALAALCVAGAVALAGCGGTGGADTIVLYNGQHAQLTDALVAAFTLSLTHAGATLGVEPLTADTLRITAGVAAVGVAIAAAGRVVLSLPRRL